MEQKVGVQSVQRKFMELLAAIGQRYINWSAVVSRVYRMNSR